MFKFITQKPLWINVLVVIVLTTLLVLIFFGSLDTITKHGQYKKVPSVLGRNVNEAIKILEAKGFEVEILDSIYIDSLPRLSVTRQAPESNATVKVNRTIYLTINRSQPPLVEMPNLVGFSIRNAQMYLENLGLRMGDTTFRPDIAKNAVLEQLYMGNSVPAGTKIYMGSIISFVLGNGVGDEEMQVPDLLGKTFCIAKQMLTDKSLNLTAVFDADVTDSANAFVYRQRPEKYGPSADGEKHYNIIKPGQNIDVYLSIKPYVPDSTNGAANLSLPQEP